MPLRSYALAAALAFAASGAAVAAEPSVPPVGSEGGVVVPHALPGPEAPGPHAGQHLTSPSGTDRPGSERGPVVPNALAGRTGAIDESRPHSDVVAQPGLVPATGQERGVNPPGSR